MCNTIMPMEASTLFAHSEVDSTIASIDHVLQCDCLHPQRVLWWGLPTIEMGNHKFMDIIFTYKSANYTSEDVMTTLLLRIGRRCWHHPRTTNV